MCESNQIKYENKQPSRIQSQNTFCMKKRESQTYTISMGGKRVLLIHSFISKKIRNRTWGGKNAFNNNDYLKHIVLVVWKKEM